MSAEQDTLPMHEQRYNYNRHSWLIPLLCLLSGGALLGLSTNLAKQASEQGLSPQAFLSWSISGAAVLLLIIASLRKALPPMNKRTVQYFFISALLGVAGSNLIFFSAIPHVGASFVALSITMSPLLTYLGALLLKVEQFRSMRAMGVVAALAGAGVLAAGKLVAPDTDTLWIFLTLIGPVLLAMGNLYRSLHWPPGVSADALAPGMLCAAACMLLLAGVLPGFSLSVPLDDKMPMIFIIVQVMVFAAQFLLLFLLQKTGGPVLLSLLGAVAAVVSVPVAIFLQGEAPPQGLILGAILIAIGVGLVTFGRPRSP